MKRFLVDVNVALDAVLARAPHTEASTRFWTAIEGKRATGLLPAHGVTTLFYLLTRARGAASAHQHVADVLSVFGVAAVGQAVLQRALALDWPDFEDAVCAAAAEAAACDAIVTRDLRGFGNSPVRAVHPATALAILDEDAGPGRVAERARSASGARPKAVRAPRRAASTRAAGHR